MYDMVNLNIAIKDYAIKVGKIRVLAILSSEDGTLRDIELLRHYDLSYAI